MCAWTGTPFQTRTPCCRRFGSLCRCLSVVRCGNHVFFGFLTRTSGLDGGPGCVLWRGPAKDRADEGGSLFSPLSSRCCCCLSPPSHTPLAVLRAPTQNAFELASILHLVDTIRLEYNLEPGIFTRLDAEAKEVCRAVSFSFSLISSSCCL